MWLSIDKHVRFFMSISGSTHTLYTHIKENFYSRWARKHTYSHTLSKAEDEKWHKSKADKDKKMKFRWKEHLLDLPKYAHNSISSIHNSNKQINFLSRYFHRKKDILKYNNNSHSYTYDRYDFICSKKMSTILLIEIIPTLLRTDMVIMLRWRSLWGHILRARAPSPIDHGAMP